MTFSETMHEQAVYWNARREAEGDTYVAKNSTQWSYDEQLAAVAPLLAEAVPLGGRVLDFGCGPGRFREVLEERAHEYVGVDLVPGLSTVDWDFENLPGGFDVVVAVFVLQHVTDAEAFGHWVRQLHDCLKPGGRLIVLDHEPMDDAADHMAPRGIFGVLDEAPWKGSRNQPAKYDDHWFGIFAKEPAPMPEVELPVFRVDYGENLDRHDVFLSDGSEMPDVMPLELAILEDSDIATRSGDVIDFRLANGRWVYQITGWHGFHTLVAELMYHEDVTE